MGLGWESDEVLALMGEGNAYISDLCCLIVYRIGRPRSDGGVGIGGWCWS